jgi:hypothetical protein
MTKNRDSDRDNFSSETLKVLAGRAGYMCSMPGCKRLTVGPSDSRTSGLTNVGVGAHITAASNVRPTDAETPWLTSLGAASYD